MYAYTRSDGDYDVVNFTNIERFQIKGTNFNDTFDRGGYGVFNIDGGAGTDIIRYADFSSETTGLTVDNSGITLTQANGNVVKNVEVFANLWTGSGNDTINYSVGLRNYENINTCAGNDTINSGSGRDTVDGGEGNDLLIVDYSSNLYAGTPTYPSGIVSSINPNGFGGWNGYFFAYNLSNGDYDIVNFSNIERFQITGTNANDSITTGDGDDVITGGMGNDTINVRNGNDILIGVNPNSSNPGRGEVDSLTGELGRDRFILGDFNWIGYDDGDSTLAGNNDYAQITDFNPTDDIIQLWGTSSNYLLTVSGTDTKLYLDKPGSEPDELIAILQNRTGLSLTASYFNYFFALPNITVFVNPASVNEDGIPNLIYTFTRDGSLSNPLTVNYTIGGTTDSTDYIGATPGTGKTITFAAGSSTATLTIDPTADTTIEPDETVALTLATGIGYAISTTTAVTGIILNDDFPTITLAVPPTSVIEDGTTNLVYTFTRTGATTSALTVNYSITGTADATDYTGATPGTGKTITFAAGSATATLTLDPTADTTIESDETVALTLTTGTGYTVGTTTAVTGTITNDDFPTLSINDITVVEGKDANAFLTVSLSSPINQTVSVNYTTIAINATAGSDYTTTSGILSFAPNSTLAAINIPILNDDINESLEAFTVNLSNPVNAKLNTNASIGEVTISDTWYSGLTRTLPNGVENLTLIGVNAINGTGNSGNNILTGNSANNTLNGSTGIDTLIGGLGNDIYQIDSTTDVIIENANEGSDTIQSSVTFSLSAFPNIENLTLTGSAAINGTGNASNNSLTGNTVNNTLDGGDGNDTLIGGLGNDIYQIDSTTDVIIENANEGSDTIQSSVTFSLSAFPNIENLTLTGSAAINGTGNASNNVITGNSANNTLTGDAGNDTLNGSTGVDTLIGGTGDDIYVVDSTTDVITENTGEGTDTIQSSVTFSLATFPNIENLTLTGSSVINGTGNVANNSLTGNAANNTLDGGDGNDTLNGGAGNDTLIGGNGNDLAYYYSSTASVTVNLVTGTASDGLGGTDTLSQIENVQGSNTAGDNLTGSTGVNVLYGYGGADILTGGGGNDLLYVGSDTVTDTVNYASGDGVDTVYNFVRGVGGDILKFTSIAAIDVQVSGTNTLFKVGDGISGNTGFGSGTLLLTTSATTGFFATDVNVNLLGATFAFS